MVGSYGNLPVLSKADGETVVCPGLAGRTADGERGEAREARETAVCSGEGPSPVSERKKVVTVRHWQLLL
jgi:hypothetical protein